MKALEKAYRERLKEEIRVARHWFYVQHPRASEGMLFVDLAKAPEGRLLAGLVLLDSHLDAMERDWKHFKIKPSAVQALPFEMQTYAKLGGVYRYEQFSGDRGFLVEAERPNGEMDGIGLKVSGAFMTACCEEVL